ncbi:MAG: hypothetical protein JO352_27555 [Chloroflexi bacterium]|nr:hypothetical protein [Chloroflexota bacterium]MBV9596400.1 hypothetical protein [Chloroflexota bacterium]
MNYSPPNPIDRLRDELSKARHCILNLMPEAYQGMLRSYYHCETREDRMRWKNAVADEIVAEVEAIPQQQVPARGPWSQDRANCPLRGRGSSSEYTSGFTLPEGLRRHLAGWGDSQYCPVVEEITQLAHAYWHDTFAEADAAEDRAKAAALAARRASETLYRTAPGGDPELLDGPYSYRATRTPDGLQWAEERLRGLGFSIECSDRIWTATYQDGEHIVYADHRQPGQLAFYVYPLPASTARRRKPRLLGQFTIFDTWKHDLPAKFQDRLAPATQIARR